MTNDELDRVRAKEARRLFHAANRYAVIADAVIIAARLAREGWMPPDPLEAEVNRIFDAAGYINGDIRHSLRKALERGIEIGEANARESTFSRTS